MSSSSSSSGGYRGRVGGLPNAPGGPTSLHDLFRSKYLERKRRQLSSSSSSSSSESKKRCLVLMPEELYEQTIESPLYGSYLYNGRKDAYAPFPISLVYQSEAKEDVEWRPEDVCPYSPGDEKYLVLPKVEEPLKTVTQFWKRYNLPYSDWALTLDKPYIYANLREFLLEDDLEGALHPHRGEVVDLVKLAVDAEKKRQPPEPVYTEKAKSWDELWDRYRLPNDIYSSVRHFLRDNLAAFPTQVNRLSQNFTRGQYSLLKHAALMERLAH